MTPAELEQIRKMIDQSVSTAINRTINEVIKPLREDIDKLRKVDTRHDEKLRTHSGTHKDLTTNIRQSKSEIESKVDEDMIALAQRDRHIAEAIQSVETRVLQKIEDVKTTSLAPIKTTTEATSVATQTLAVDQKLTKSEATSAKGWTQAAIVISIIAQAIATGIIGALQAAAKATPDKK